MFARRYEINGAVAIHRACVSSHDQMRDAVHVPEHRAPRQVPDPDEPERWPNPVAFFKPLARTTLILPASATLPEACTIELDTWPLLMPIETVWPSPHSLLEEAMRTLHVPSKASEAAA